MADPLPRRDDGDNPSKNPLSGTPDMSRLSPLAPTPGQAKHWAKHYRTEIAACSSSVLSTFVAVSGIAVPYWDECRCANAVVVSVGFRQNPHAGVCPPHRPLTGDVERSDAF